MCALCAGCSWWVVLRICTTSSPCSRSTAARRNSSSATPSASRRPTPPTLSHLPVTATAHVTRPCSVSPSQAVRSFNVIIPLLPRADLASKFLPILKRLANGDWFTTRVSATGLFASAYPLLPDALQSELRSLFNNLCNDDTPMVRKAAFTQLGPYALTLQRSFLKSDVYPIVKAVAVDDMDSMRMYAIDACASLVSIVDLNDYSTVLLPIIDGLQDDASWRVRQSLATHFAALTSSPVVAWDSIGRRLFLLYIKLMRDKESEVRTAACQHMDTVFVSLAKEGVASASLREAIEGQQATLDALATDPIQNVKVAYSKAITGLCPVLGKELSAKVIVPLLSTLSKDEYYEVRHYIFSRLHLLAEYLGHANLTALVLPLVIDLSKDSKWRVRYNVIDQAALLARYLGQVQFTKKLLPVLLGALSDHVYAIRQLSCRQLGVICKMREFGGRWAVERMFSGALTLYDKTTNYLHRMTCLLLIEECIREGGSLDHLDPVDSIGERDATAINASLQAAVAPPPDAGSPPAPVSAAQEEAETVEMIDKTCVPILLAACTDDVPNVRLAAAKAVITLLGSEKADKKALVGKFAPLLTKMTTDTDPDVSYFSHVAVRRMQ